MSYIFISYSRTDEAFARRLADALASAGADVWIDKADIPAGMKWSSAIKEGLDQCDLMIVVISPDSMVSRNVEDKWQFYLHEGKPVVPILLREARLPFQLNRLQYINFERQPFETAFKQLHEALRRIGLQLNEGADVPSQSPGMFAPTGSTPMLLPLWSIVAVAAAAVVALSALNGGFRGGDVTAATQAALNATATAKLWTPTPTATATPTSTPTRTPTVTPTTNGTPDMTASIEAMDTRAAALPLTETALASGGSELATAAAAATGTANAFDTQATADAATETAAPPVPLAVAQVKTFQIVDEGGAILGNGEVRVLAPSSIALDESAEIRVEIQVDSPLPGIAAQLNPPPSPTPALGTPRPTPSPLPTVDVPQFIEVREFMGAGLRGADFDQFEAQAVPPSGLRLMRPDVINWWKWNIRAVDQAATGTNQLEVYIYVPQKRSDGTEFELETNIIPFQIDVLAPHIDPIRAIVTIAGAITAIGGAVAILYKGYQYLSERSSKSSKKQNTWPFRERDK